jgi:hypothetical protein
MGTADKETPRRPPTRGEKAIASAMVLTVAGFVVFVLARGFVLIWRGPGTNPSLIDHLNVAVTGMAIAVVVLAVFGLLIHALKPAWSWFWWTLTTPPAKPDEASDEADWR